MTDEFEQALRRALQVKGPGEDFAGRIVSRVSSSDAQLASVTRLRTRRARWIRSPWLPAALAACIIAGIALVEMRQHALDTQRADQARAQLLQALSIASDSVNAVRAAVAREENPDS
jgi:hypothetical protein